jgi:Ca2+-binding RTX toxin-like protein
MTTLILQGFQVEYDDDTPQSLQAAKLEFIFSEGSSTTGSYDILGFVPGEGFPEVDFSLDSSPFQVELNNQPLNDDNTTFFLGHIVSGGQTYTIFSLLVNIPGQPAQDYLFQMAGPSLDYLLSAPDPVAAFIALGDAATFVGAATGAFAEGETIDLATVTSYAFTTQDDVFISGNYDTNIFVGGGADSVSAQAGNDRINGGAGNDTLSGNGGDDVLIGGAGDDSLSGGAGDDLLIGGNIGEYLSSNIGLGFVEVFSEAIGPEGTYLDFYNAVFRIFPDEGDGTFSYQYTANPGDYPSNVTLSGLDGVIFTVGDSFYTMDDILGAEVFTLLWGAGKSTILLSLTLERDNFNQTDRTFAIVLDGDALPAFTSAADLMAFDETQVTGESLVTSGAFAPGQMIALDSFLGAAILPGSDAGNDTINGGMGDDTLLDGAGNDSLSGGEGNDMIFANAGMDTYDGGAGFDTLEFIDTGAANGDYTMVVDLVNNTTYTQEAPTVNPSQVFGIENVFYFGATNAVLIGDGENNILMSDQGNDSLSGGIGNDSLEGGGGNDTLEGGDGDDFIASGSGADLISGGDGNDQIEGTVADLANDIITDFAAGDSIRVVNGGADGTTVSLNAATGVVTLTGGTGGTGTFTLQGFTGALSTTVQGNGLLITVAVPGTGETIVGGDGGETLVAGAGDDTITAGIGNDRLEGLDGDDVITGGAGNDSILGGAGNDSLFGDDGNDVIAASDGDDIVSGGEGNDNIGGGDGNDSIDGDGGSDTIGGGTGDDTIDGGGGNDMISGGYGADTVLGGEGNDTLAGSFGADLVKGDSGDDSLGGGGGIDTIYGGGGDDMIGGGDGGDLLFGDAGDDFIAGGEGNDVINGGTGNDTINGGTGNDVMRGGAGADVFVFTDFNNGEIDTIYGFEDGIDKIRVSISALIENNNPKLADGFQFDDLSIGDFNIGGTNFALVIWDGHTIRIGGMESALLGANDFIFV